MLSLDIKYLWNKSDFFGRASLIFRYAAYIFNGIFLFVFLYQTDKSADLWSYLTLLISITFPYLIFRYYVKNNNDKGIGIRQNMIDFLVVGWFLGLIELIYVPSFIFTLGLFSNYIASRGFHKIYRLLLIPVGYMLTVPIYGFQLNTDDHPVLLHLALAYALIHFVSIAYISYSFSKNLQLINRKVVLQSDEITTQAEELKSLNESLRVLNNHLEDKVYDRTKELEQKNAKLAEYTFINGHQLRAPVATLLGLCNLFEYSKEASEKEYIISKLREELQLLDITIKEIRLKLETDDILLNKVREVETAHSHFEKLKNKVK